jgi:hypothetical protein
MGGLLGKGEIRPLSGLRIYETGSLNRFHYSCASARKPGWPPREREGGWEDAREKLTAARHRELARTLYDGGQTDIATICQTLGIPRTTLYRTLRTPPQPQETRPQARPDPPRP